MSCRFPTWPERLQRIAERPIVRAMALVVILGSFAMQGIVIAHRHADGRSHLQSEYEQD
jgi:hypothetical protein